jgi:hypothetical protein
LTEVLQAIPETTIGKVHPLRTMATGIASIKLSSTRLEGSSQPAMSASRDSETAGGTAMRQRTFQASAVAFVLGLGISLVWSFLYLHGF